MDKLTAEQRQQLDEMMSRLITPEDMARSARRFIYENTRMMLKLDEEEYNKEWIADGHYWLNELAEILDPQLEKTT